MTYQLATAAVGRSKATLAAALNERPERVAFTDPSLFGPRGGGSFTGADFVAGERAEVVLDPATRRRFARIVRKRDGSFRV